jgi:hypothetical protein
VPVTTILISEINVYIWKQMSYVQIRTRIGDQALARSLELDPAGRIGGYPAYSATYTPSLGSVLTIMYRDESGVYLTEDKLFRLTRIGNRLFFDGSVIPAILGWPDRGM